MLNECLPQRCHLIYLNTSDKSHPETKVTLYEINIGMRTYSNDVLLTVLSLCMYGYICIIDLKHQSCFSSLSGVNCPS